MSEIDSLDDKLKKGGGMKLEFMFLLMLWIAGIMLGLIISNSKMVNNGKSNIEKCLETIKTYEDAVKMYQEAICKYDSIIAAYKEQNDRLIKLVEEANLRADGKGE